MVFVNRRGTGSEIRSTRGVAEKIFGAPLPWSGDEVERWGPVPPSGKFTHPKNTQAKRSDSYSPCGRKVNELGAADAGGEGGCAETGRRWDEIRGSLKGDSNITLARPSVNRH